MVGISVDGENEGEGTTINETVRKIIDSWFEDRDESKEVAEVDYREQSEVEQPDGMDSYNVYVVLDDGTEVSGVAYNTRKQYGKPIKVRLRL